MTLGDRSRSADLVERALWDAAGRLDELRHPERAAAWLRQRVVRSLRSGVLTRRLRATDTLGVLGAEARVMRAMASLAPLERAALVASDIERLDPRDVAVVVGRDAPGLERLLRRARQRYLRSYSRMVDGPVPHGPTVARIQAIARRQMT